MSKPYFDAAPLNTCCIRCTHIFIHRSQTTVGHVEKIEPCSSEVK